MKSILRFFVAVAFLATAATAIAGKGGPTVEGDWTGAGQAVYPDGTSAVILEVEASLLQDGHFFYGEASFIVSIGESDPFPQGAQMSGHIKGNALTGLMGFCFDDAPDCIGAGVFEGKLSGNRLSGTVVDLSDGSTSFITLHRTSID